MFKSKKCQYGYIWFKRISQISLTVIGLIFVVAMFALGVKLYGTSSNYVSIIASLCALPFAKTTSDFIISLSYKPTSKKLHEKVSQRVTHCIANYDCIFRKRKELMQLQAVVTTHDVLCVYTENSKADLKYYEKLLKNYMIRAGYSITINVYNNEQQFLKRVEHLNSVEQKTSSEGFEKKMTAINETIKDMFI